MVLSLPIKEQKGLWVFVVPISKLILTHSIGEEITINQITFISKRKLTFVRKRLGLPFTVSELKEKYSEAFNKFFDSETYAIWKIGGEGKKRKKEFLELVKKELEIISLSQLVFGKRNLNANLSISNDKKIGDIKCLMLHQNKSFSKDSFITGNPINLILDQRWKDFHSYSFFFILLDVLKENKFISSGWQRDISAAAYMAGQSQSTSNLPQAFLWNMIAIETLLAHQGDSYSKQLPLRVEAFIGWTQDWSNSNFHKKIEDAYTKRCKYVHCGQFEQITMEDVEFTDQIVFNIFFNILKHLELFSDKNSIIEFSEKVQAEKILGIKSKVRPKTFKYAKRWE